MSIRDRYDYGPKDKLGEGGFATVFAATDKRLKRTVALKFYTNKGEHEKSLVNEIRTAIALEHLNLCRYFDVEIEKHENMHGEIEQVEIGIMEFIDGGEIDDFVRKNPNSINRLLKGVLEGLKYLHSKHIIHRDLKPSNILVKTNEGIPVAKIVDFGISKNIDSQKSRSSQLMGTVKYMAPEQFDPKNYGINGRIALNLDFWAFGLILYELIAKQPLIEIDESMSFTEIATTIHQNIDYSRIERLPSPYKEMVRLCIVQNANYRVKTADELIQILEGATSGSSQKTRILEDEPKQEETEINYPKKIESKKNNSNKVKNNLIAIILGLLVISSIIFYSVKDDLFPKYVEPVSDEDSYSSYNDDIEQDSLVVKSDFFPDVPNVSNSELKSYLIDYRKFFKLNHYMVDNPSNTDSLKEMRVRKIKVQLFLKWYEDNLDSLNEDDLARTQKFIEDINDLNVNLLNKVNK